MRDEHLQIYDISDLDDAGDYVDDREDDPPYDRTYRRSYDRGDDEDAAYEEPEQRPRRGIGHILSWIFPFVVLAILVVSLTLFLREWLTYKAAGDEYTLVKEKIVIPEEPEVETEDGMTYPALDIDFDALLASNPEFVCVIYIPALDLYYPVAQAEDNSKYLTTTFEGSTNPSGCIFLDANASADFTDRNTFIYGHNMKNETMFGSLKRFSADEDLCATHPYIYLYLADGRVLKYHIFAYYTTPVNDAVYNGINTDREYDSYVIRAQSRSYYAPTEEEKDDFDARPNLLTLSTCWGNDHKNNFVVHGALLGEADTAVERVDDASAAEAITE